MGRNEILQILNDHKAELKRFGVGSLALFGSTARDEAGTDSDVDILVEFDGAPSFGRFMDLKFYLEDLLGCPVDLVTRRALKPRLRTRVEEEAVHVAGFQTVSG
jgi:predicted nucleotidyltransferase